MTKGRIVNNKISRSERVNALPVPARLLYTWLIAHLDREGRFSGNPRIIKQTVIPLTNYSLSVVDNWLDEMQAQKDSETGFGLIERYEVEGKQYLWMPGFDSEQGQGRGGSEPAWKSREAASGIPAPPNQPQKPKPREEKKGFDKSGILDELFGQMVDVYERNIGIITPSSAERIKIIRDEYPEGWFSKAVDEAVSYNKRNLRYIERILERWKVEGLGKEPVTQTNSGRVIDYKFD